MAKKETPSVSPLMQWLRNELDRRGVPWRDLSYEINQEHLTHHVEITRFKDPDGVQASVTWGWQIWCGTRRGVSAGFPDKLECWYKPDGPKPRILTVEEIISMCLEGGNGNGRA